MRKYLSLTRVLLKNSMGMMSDGKSKKALNVFIYGVLAVCMIPLGFTLYMMFNTAMAQPAAGGSSSGTGLSHFLTGNLSVFHFSDSIHLLFQQGFRNPAGPSAAAADHSECQIQCVSCV